MANSTDKKILIAELAAARGELHGCTTALRHDLDFGARLKRGILTHRGIWFGGAAVLGLLLSRLPFVRRKHSVKVPSFRAKKDAPTGQTAFALTALKLGLDFAKPALLRWFKDRYLNAPRGVSNP